MPDLIKKNSQASVLGNKSLLFCLYVVVFGFNISFKKISVISLQLAILSQCSLHQALWWLISYYLLVYLYIWQTYLYQGKSNNLYKSLAQLGLSFLTTPILMFIEFRKPIPLTTNRAKGTSFCFFFQVF